MDSRGFGLVWHFLPREIMLHGRGSMPSLREVSSRLQETNASILLILACPQGGFTRPTRQEVSSLRAAVEGGVPGTLLHNVSPGGCHLIFRPHAKGTCCTEDGIGTVWRSIKFACSQPLPLLFFTSPCCPPGHQQLKRAGVITCMCHPMAGAATLWVNLGRVSQFLRMLIHSDPS